MNTQSVKVRPVDPGTDFLRMAELMNKLIC